MITLTPEQEREIIEGAKLIVAKTLLAERRDKLDTLLPVEVCGILKINQKTLDTLKDGPRRVTLVPGSVIRYRACDLAEYLESRTEKKGGKS